MSDIQTQLPVKLTNGTNTVSITSNSAALFEGVGTAGTATGGVLTVQGVSSMTPFLCSQNGTWNITNVSGTVSLPTGAATAAKQPALGTAGSASTDVITIQGISSMTAVKVDGTGGTFTVSQGTASNLKAQITGTGSAGSADSGVVTIQGIASMTAVKVDGSAVTQPVSFGETSSGIVAFQSSSSAVANSSTGTITYTVTSGKTLYLKQIIAAASGGPCKVVVDYGAGPTVIGVVFFSSAIPWAAITFAQPISISASTAVNVKITNNAGASQDVYASIFGHEV